MNPEQIAEQKAKAETAAYSEKLVDVYRAQAAFDRAEKSGIGMAEAEKAFATASHAAQIPQAKLREKVKSLGFEGREHEAAYRHVAGIAHTDAEEAAREERVTYLKNTPHAAIDLASSRVSSHAGFSRLK